MPFERLAVVLAVGLTAPLASRLGALREMMSRGRLRRVRPPFPAVTCTAQSTMLTGLAPSGHGIVGNGWYDRSLAEVQFWKQSNRLVSGERVWETLRRLRPGATCANICWWYNMYSSVDVSITPRPIYAADGRKFPDCYTEPADLRREVQDLLGPFPLFSFWGPGAGISSSAWIARAAAHVERRASPVLSLVYLPHLDYAHQRHGPEAPESARALEELDGVLTELMSFYASRGVGVAVVSEYGIEPVSTPIYLNRVLRGSGLVRVREERGGELLDAGASRAFAVCDHQAAHVYVRDPQDVPAVAALVSRVPGVERVLDAAGQRAAGLDHPRSGELVVVAEEGCWFAYPYWLEDSRAPDFARTVEIHRKPGYDPAELFVDPRIRWPRLAVGRRLVMKRLGFRVLMDVIPLEAGLVRGSHGRREQQAERMPVLITPDAPPGPDEIEAGAVRDEMLRLLGAR